MSRHPPMGRGARVDDMETPPEWQFGECTILACGPFIGRHGVRAPGVCWHVVACNVWNAGGGMPRVVCSRFRAVKFGRENEQRKKASTATLASCNAPPPRFPVHAEDRNACCCRPFVFPLFLANLCAQGAGEGIEPERMHGATWEQWVRLSLGTMIGCKPW